MKMIILETAVVAFESDSNMTHEDLSSVKYMPVVNCFVLSRFEKIVYKIFMCR